LPNVQGALNDPIFEKALHGAAVALVQYSGHSLQECLHIAASFAKENLKKTKEACREMRRRVSAWGSGELRPEAFAKGEVIEVLTEFRWGGSSVDYGDHSAEMGPIIELSLKDKSLSLNPGRELLVSFSMPKAGLGEVGLESEAATSEIWQNARVLECSELKLRIILTKPHRPSPCSHVTLRLGWQRATVVSCGNNGLYGFASEGDRTRTGFLLGTSGVPAVLSWRAGVRARTCKKYGEEECPSPLRIIPRRLAILGWEIAIGR
jgi:hypothetical protein